MEDLFRQFWWLLFPLFGMCMGAYGMWNDQRRRRDTIDLLKVYAQKGEEPPPALLKAVSQPADNDSWNDGGFGLEEGYGRPRNPYNEWRNFALFVSLGAAFLFAAFFGPGAAQWAFIMVAIIMGGLAAGSLIMALLKQRDARR